MARPPAFARLLGAGDVGIFRPGYEARATRIPALVRSGRGTLLAFAELRSSRDDDGYIAIGLRRSTDGGRTWGEPQRVSDVPGATARNPVPVALEDGRILLISCLSGGEGSGPVRVLVHRSDDDGVTWSEPRDITDAVRRPEWRWYATGPGAVAPLASGRILIPANHSQGGVFRAHAFLSDDGGESWRLGGTVETPLTNEGQLAQRPDGRVLLYLRTRAPGGKVFAVSDDEGDSWRVESAPHELTGPVCQSDIIAVGDELYATTHVHRTQRRGLELRRSRDGGRTWPDAARIVLGSSGYSDLAALPDGRIAVLFERFRHVAFRIVEPTDLR